MSGLSYLLCYNNGELNNEAQEGRMWTRQLTFRNSFPEHMDFNNAEVKEGQMRPILHMSALLGDENNVRRLISAGTDPNELDFAGCTAVQLAAAAGYFNVVKLLVTEGATVDNQDESHGNTALHEASWRGYSNLVKFLSNSKTVNIQNKGGFTPLHLACQAGHNQCTRELLLGGGNPNLANTYGDSALHTAVRYGHAGVTRILLSARALTDVTNKNGDTALHISAAMGRKKLTHILLSAGCVPNVQNNQKESPLDISIRKGFEDVTQILKNPPEVLTPMQRDEMRASKYKGPKITTQNPQPGSSKELRREILTTAHVHPENPKRSSKRSLHSSNNGSKSKSTSSINVLKGSEPHSEAKATRSTTKSPAAASHGNVFEEVPKWSPYGCHNQPNPGAFPPPNIDSLPKDPLTTGELYYLDLAGNIHKGPMGVSEGCYCGPLLLTSSNSQSLLALNGAEPQPVYHRDKHHKAHKDKRKSRHEPLEEDLTPRPSGLVRDTTKYEDQLKTLTHQLSRIHLDTQAQLSSLHSMLNERLKDKPEDEPVHQDEIETNETKLKEWVRLYRRFRKELAKNPKTLQQANDLLASASSLLSTRIASPAPPDSETDSGL